MRLHLSCFLVSAIALGLTAWATTAQAGVTNTATAVGSATDFNATSINGGTLSIDTLNPGLGAGGTIAGGQAQGLPVPSPGIAGEALYWSGANATLSAITMINAGGGGGVANQPFLVDLGFSAAPVYTSGSSLFIPNNFPNLLSGSLSVTFPAAASKQFEEMDFDSADAVTLQQGHTYFAGFVTNNSGTSEWNFLRANGLHTYPNGNAYIGASLTQTTNITSAPYGGGPRDWFMGVYATAVPEPGTIALLAAGIPGLAWVIRRRK